MVRIGQRCIQESKFKTQSNRESNQIKIHIVVLTKIFNLLVRRRKLKKVSLELWRGRRCTDKGSIIYNIL